jgi:hypothetical protein
MRTLLSYHLHQYKKIRTRGVRIPKTRMSK